MGLQVSAHKDLERYKCSASEEHCTHRKNWDSFQYHDDKVGEQKLVQPLSACTSSDSF